MREDRMSKLFRKISSYTEKHLHLLPVSSSTSTQWAGPPSTVPAYVCECVCVFVLLSFLFFLKKHTFVHPCVLKGPGREIKKEARRWTNATFAARQKGASLTGRLRRSNSSSSSSSASSSSSRFVWQEGFKLSSPAEER